MKRVLTRTTVLWLAILLFVLAPSAAGAAAFEFSVTAKKAFDNMVAAADSSTGAKLKKQYADLSSIQQQDVEWEKKINDLHYRNEEAEVAVNKRIKEIDAAKLIQLASEVERTKAKYGPLFEQYESLGRQLSLARSLKSKGLAAILGVQVEAAKTAVQFAKQDIKSKETALANAKASAAAAAKRVKETLAGSDTVEVKIKAAKSAISSIKRQFSTETSILNQVVRKGDSTATFSSFTRMIAYQRQIIEQRQKLYQYEQQIAGVLSKAWSQIPAK